MVEGPGVRVQCERLQRFASRRLMDVVGHVPGLAAALPAVLLSICCFGKQLFLVCADAYLRIHFGMNGTTRVNGCLDDPDRRLVAELHFEADVLRLYDCTVRCVAGPLDPATVQPQLDFCSEQYCPEASLRVARAGSHVTICDLLLDQSVCPGVGNVIKCEALFRAQVHPKTAARELPEQRLCHVLQASRAFTLEWYHAKVHRATTCVRHIYSARRCPVCGSAVAKEYVGRSDRLTFWCPQCQAEDAHLRPPAP
eukprot:EG_transcript_25321